MLKYHKPLTNVHRLLTSAIRPYFLVCIRTTFTCLLLHIGTRFIMSYFVELKRNY